MTPKSTTTGFSSNSERPRRPPTVESTVDPRYLDAVQPHQVWKKRVVRARWDGLAAEGRTVPRSARQSATFGCLDQLHGAGEAVDPRRAVLPVRRPLTAANGLRRELLNFIGQPRARQYRMGCTGVVTGRGEARSAASVAALFSELLS